MARLRRKIYSVTRTSSRAQVLYRAYRAKLPADTDHLKKILAHYCDVATVPKYLWYPGYCHETTQTFYSDYIVSRTPNYYLEALSRTWL